MCGGERPRPAMLRALERDEPRDHRIVEIEAGRDGAAQRIGRGVEFVIGQQHQRAAEQIFGCLVAGRPGRGHLFVQRRGARFGVQDRRRDQAHDARADLRPALARAVEGARIGIAGQRQHGDGARRSALRLCVAAEHGAHGVATHRQIVGREGIAAIASQSRVAVCSRRRGLAPAPRRGRRDRSGLHR